jgi:hypothetical protein
MQLVDVSIGGLRKDKLDEARRELLGENDGDHLGNRVNFNAREEETVHVDDMLGAGVVFALDGCHGSQVGEAW